MVATFVVALAILKKGWKQKLVTIGMFIAGTLPWILGWTIRNKFLAENATNRSLCGIRSLLKICSIGLRTVPEAFFPYRSLAQGNDQKPCIVEGLIVLILGAVLVWLAMRPGNIFPSLNP